jgi:hypothetical protein
VDKARGDKARGDKARGDKANLKPETLQPSAASSAKLNPKHIPNPIDYKALNAAVLNVAVLESLIAKH